MGAMEFSKTLTVSPLALNGENWISSSQLEERNLEFEPAIFVGSASYLLANPNVTSSHLFRADILFDSSGMLKTPKEKESDTVVPKNGTSETEGDEVVEPLAARNFDGFYLTRTILRRFIPRNQNLDPELDQTCHFYSQAVTLEDQGLQVEKSLLIYLPHYISENKVPFYHPAVRALGFLYEFSVPLLRDPDETKKGNGTLSLHFLPFAPGIPEEIPYRLERTFLALLSTQARLARSPSATSNPTGSKPKPFKDNIIPQHILQTTYVRLKNKYASTLIEDWVEVTEPSKHVFEDIAIAAFLIELWKIMYNSEPGQSEGDAAAWFPGFVDIACGNGVLVHLLLAEGYSGWGFDARRRKSWNIYPPTTQSRLKESIFIPEVFRSAAPILFESIPDSVSVNDGVFEKNTFIISNHADELTIWTPLLGALSNPSSPLPFLAIPCCSHSISGSRFRYPPPSKKSSTPKQKAQKAEQENEQPSTGDLKALRATKLAQQVNGDDFPSSTYGALTAKTMDISSEMGYDVQKTLMRIPSTRNIGIVGGLNRCKAIGKCPSSNRGTAQTTQVEQQIKQLVEREAARDGGLEAAATIWIGRALGLHQGKGGKSTGTHRLPNMKS
ncbi:tRNA(Ser) Um(44) 2'-O-methyltransferase [Ophidiomyces ophidiicola]|nr:tRNA(Ser) Um(44) 2'-O-methyltransferase [Ophidiomyces ophidiicola]KAI2007322.1 tRNA(Ser) Um(44) 2'-O-methyltransferase [Ophidiomyces ophidiicola]KAI2015137.1 tRNA(Ser) Um(44) 2'-O-methyltransferase [Ophidiomyces ophidiicola]KAI2018894.1 tRNA(Ser) Um(44) 2'-O-methyltransferase [Ophidiomyces ophidiicola]KAI2138954.1 tRNA(Ser) Um(44) 2'-O-methyltransferase [Ophidiomyces ophidiicola]